MPARRKWGPQKPSAPSPISERVVVGLQPVREAIRVRGAEIARLALQVGGSPQLESLARFANDHGVFQVERITRSEMDRVAAGVVHQGVVAWAPPLQLLEPRSLLERPTLLAIVLDGIEDPQNFGAVIRSAVALARAPVFWAEHSSAPLGPATYRASAGAIEHAELCRVPSLRSLLDEARSRNISIVGLDPKAERSLATLDVRRPTLLVVGSEHAGLSRGTRIRCTQLARLVSAGVLDSLNASVACGIALYESVIQRLFS